MCIKKVRELEAKRPAEWVEVMKAIEARKITVNAANVRMGIEYHDFERLVRIDYFIHGKKWAIPSCKHGVPRPNTWSQQLLLLEMGVQNLQQTRHQLGLTQFWFDYYFWFDVMTGQNQFPKTLAKRRMYVPKIPQGWDQMLIDIATRENSIKVLCEEMYGFSKMWFYIFNAVLTYQGVQLPVGLPEYTYNVPKPLDWDTRMRQIKNNQVAVKTVQTTWKMSERHYYLLAFEEELKELKRVLDRQAAAKKNHVRPTKGKSVKSSVVGRNAIKHTRVA